MRRQRSIVEKMKENIEKPQKKNGVVSFLKEEEVKEEGKNACNDLSLSLSLSLLAKEKSIRRRLCRARAYSLSKAKNLDEHDKLRIFCHDGILFLARFPKMRARIIFKDLL